GGGEGVERAAEVDRRDRLPRRGADNQEREVHHHVGAAECVPQGVGVADVPATVLQLRPAVRRRVERAPGDAHHPRHPVIGLEQRKQAEPEGPGGAGHRDRQVPLAVTHGPHSARRGRQARAGPGPLDVRAEGPGRPGRSGRSGAVAGRLRPSRAATVPVAWTAGWSRAAKGGLIDRLTPLDAAFIDAEDEDRHTSMAIASIAVFEGPAPSYDEFYQAVAGRLPLVPIYRRKL